MEATMRVKSNVEAGLKIKMPLRGGGSGTTER
jgi:hypothetical protein